MRSASFAFAVASASACRSSGDRGWAVPIPGEAGGGAGRPDSAAAGSPVASGTLSLSDRLPGVWRASVPDVAVYQFPSVRFDVFEQDDGGRVRFLGTHEPGG